MDLRSLFWHHHHSFSIPEANHHSFLSCDFFFFPINVPRKDSFQPVGIEVPLVSTSSKAKFLCLQLIGSFIHMLWYPKLLWSTLPYAHHLQWIPFSVYLDYYFLLLTHLKLWATLYSWKLTPSVRPPWGSWELVECEAGGESGWRSWHQGPGMNVSWGVGPSGLGSRARNPDYLGLPAHVPFIPIWALFQKSGNWDPDTFNHLLQLSRKS